MFFDSVQIGGRLASNSFCSLDDQFGNLSALFFAQGSDGYTNASAQNYSEDFGLLQFLTNCFSEFCAFEGDGDEETGVERAALQTNLVSSCGECSASSSNICEDIFKRKLKTSWPN